MEERTQGFSKKTKIALTKLIKAVEDPEKYSLPPEEKEGQNQAVIHVLKQLFKLEGDTVVGFDEEFIKQCYILQERPTIKLF